MHSDERENNSEGIAFADTGPCPICGFPMDENEVCHMCGTDETEEEPGKATIHLKEEYAEAIRSGKKTVCVIGHGAGTETLRRIAEAREKDIEMAKTVLIQSRNEDKVEELEKLLQGTRTGKPIIDELPPYRPNRAERRAAAKRNRL